MSATKPCPHCGAPVRHARDFGRLGDERWCISWTCGASSNYDGPGDPCRNRDERTTRDETTQPPEAEEPEAVQFQIDPTETPANDTEATAPAVVYPEVSTLPAIKPLADAALERLGLAVAVVEKLKGYKQLVLADLTDKKAANDLNEKRKEVKRFRVAWANACKEGRAEANAIADAWVKAQKTLVEDFEQVEDHLERQVEAHEREVARIAREAEQARQAKIQARLDAMSAAGIPVDLVRAAELSDEAWDEYLGKALEAKAKLDAATKVAEELTALGDECTAGEAQQLTDDQIEHRLAVARKADHDRKEAARLKEEEAEAERQRIADEEKASRERLERGYRRGRELALLGSTGHEVEPLADMTEEAFAVVLETARQEKTDRDSRIAEERRVQEEKDAELARLKKAEADRMEAERVALDAREAEAKANAAKAEADAKAAREEAAREQEAARLEALRPEREQVAAWARAFINAMPKFPAIADNALQGDMVDAAARAVAILGNLEQVMKGEA
jgi:hypothetical protein